jgi:arsenate reductase
MTTTIYHNPCCSKSRDALKFLNDSGVEPIVVHYVDVGWTPDTLLTLKQESGLSWETMLRADAAAELKDALENNNEQQIIHYLIANSVALERPFVTTPMGTRLCRPIQRLLEIIDQRPISPWHTEKGERVI